MARLSCPPCLLHTALRRCLSFPSLSPLPHCPCHASCLSPCLDVEVLKVERVQLIDAVLNLCTYHHPENIQLPPG